MDEKRIVELIDEAISAKIKDPSSLTDDSLLVGYNPIEKIRGSLFVWVGVPFNGTPVFCQLRCPNATQLEQCGDISNIEVAYKENKDYELSYEEIITLRNYQENICKLVLNIPKFDDIAKFIGIEDFVLSDKKEQLAVLVKKFEDHKDNMTEVEKAGIEAQIHTTELMLGYILPDDTMAFLTKWAMGNDISDIKKLTKNTLLRAASLAKVHKKAPTDYISGVFTDYNKIEIDLAAFKVLEDYIEEHKTANEAGGHKWLLGKNKSKGGG